jgi:hypothetical protein
MREMADQLENKGQYEELKILPTSLSSFLFLPQNMGSIELKYIHQYLYIFF